MLSAFTAANLAPYAHLTDAWHPSCDFNFLESCCCCTYHQPAYCSSPSGRRSVSWQRLHSATAWSEAAAAATTAAAVAVMTAACLSLYHPAATLAWTA